MNIVALVPAYDPNEVLISLVDQLVRSEIQSIVVVDDGSKASCESVFDAIRRMPGVTVLRHAVNRGKGAALKTGFNHIYCLSDRPEGVVTLDADGQHLIRDALKVAEVLAANPHNLVLGVRRLKADIPLRSYIGNTLTRVLFRALIGQDILDTQTGLRGVPVQLIPQLLQIESGRYEFELDMLLMCKHSGISVIQCPISTKYENKNESSHFSPIRDSMRIYFVLLRFSFASLSTALIDSMIFWTAFQNMDSVANSTIVARIIAVAYNYLLVKRFIFYSNQKHSVTFPKYLLLVVISGVVSVSVINTLIAVLGWHVLLAKGITESVIFLANFLVQRDLIFTRSSIMEAARGRGLLPEAAKRQANGRPPISGLQPGCSDPPAD